MTSQAVAYQYRQLIADELWQRLTARIVKDHGVEPDHAEDIMDAALGFLELCGNHSDRSFAPSAEVDIGWHTFILYTRSYKEHCLNRFGRFIHHEPSDVKGRPKTTGGPRATVRIMRTAGIPFDEKVWGIMAQDCTTESCTCSDEEDCSGDEEGDCSDEQCSGGE